MTYSLVSIIAIVVHFIVNIDAFIKFKGRKPFSGEKYYLFFLLSVIAYHLTDILWGLLYDAVLYVPLYIDTVIYFVAMACSILFWGYFVYFYLGRKNKIIVYIGLAVFLVQIIIILFNFHVPILFTLDKETCAYTAREGRYAALVIQIIMYLILAVFSFIYSIKKGNSMKRRYFTVSLFSIFMIVAIVLQVFFPLIPMYAYGYLFGVCVLHTLVVEDEKATQRNELVMAQHQISYDPLTGAMSKHAYVDAEAIVDERINKGVMEDFAMVVFDLNNLKDVNDQMGHEAGDKYIIESVRLIEDYFKDVPVYRVGGDEFTIILTGNDFKNRNQLLDDFNRRIDQNKKSNSFILVAAGLADYNRDKDTTIIQIFTRADREMYARKHLLKEQKI